MKILSFDIGMYNCSYVYLEYNENNDNTDKLNNITIIDWNIIDFTDNDPKKKKNINLLFANIPKKLDELTELINTDIVIIENQPCMRNPTMKSIQMIIYSYFLIKGTNIKIEFISAMNKLKNVGDKQQILLDINCKTTSKYLQKKKISVEYCKRLLEKYDNIKSFKDFYNNSKKKDDLSDALLQCTYYINK